MFVHVKLEWMFHYSFHLANHNLQPVNASNPAWYMCVYKCKFRLQGKTVMYWPQFRFSHTVCWTFIVELEFCLYREFSYSWNVRNFVRRTRNKTTTDGPLKRQSLLFVVRRRCWSCCRCTGWLWSPGPHPVGLCRRPVWRLRTPKYWSRPLLLWSCSVQCRDCWQPKQWTRGRSSCVPTGCCRRRRVQTRDRWHRNNLIEWRLITRPRIWQSMYNECIARTRKLRSWAYCLYALY